MYITYRVEPVAMPNPFTIKRNNQRSFRFGMFSKQGKPTSIIPEIESYVGPIRLLVNGFNVRVIYIYIYTYLPVDGPVQRARLMKPTFCFNSRKKLQVMLSSGH